MLYNTADSVSGFKNETVEVESGEEEGEEGEEEPVELLTVKKQLLESSWCGLLSALGNFYKCS